MIDALRAMTHRSPRAFYTLQVLRQGFKAKYPAGEARNRTHRVSLLDAYRWSLVAGLRQQEAFRSVTSYCMFLGHQRSGHSVIGALMDAHPQMVIAHELNALKYWAVGFRRSQVFALIVENSRRQAEAGRGESGYSYVVPHQWQGRYDTLRVIGDKDARRDVAQLGLYPQLLDIVRERVGLGIKFIHVVRNPFDNIATLATRERIDDTRHPKFAGLVKRFFAECATTARLRASAGRESVLDVHHESFVVDPRTSLTQICHFLGLDAPSDYLDDCTSIVYSSPHRSRHDFAWTAETLAHIVEQAAAYEFLEGYTFDG